MIGIMDYELEHLKLLKEEDINKNELPTSIKNKLKGLNLIIGKYKKNPTEKIKQRMIQQDIFTSDMIQDWIEQDYPDDVMDKNPIEKDVKLAEAIAEAEGESKNNPQPAPKTDETPSTERTDPKPNPKPQGGGGNDLEALIKAQLKDNKIKTNALTKIIGKKPNYPNQKVGNLILKKVFLSDTYKLVS